MQFDGFKKGAIKFLDELERNNSKEWFEKNRHIWEKEILEPNKAFVQEMGETLQILVPSIKALPKASGSLFKMYRDIRFSKDKTPMKDKVGFIFWQGTGHRMSSSSFYLQYKKNEYLVGVGIRSFKAPILKAYREYIKDEKKAKELFDILEKIKKAGYTIPEKKYKRVPKEFDKDYKYKELTLYNSLFIIKTYEIKEDFFTLNIVDKIFADYEKLSSLQNWLYELTLTIKE